MNTIKIIITIDDKVYEETYTLEPYNATKKQFKEKLKANLQFVFDGKWMDLIRFKND